jgi:hypothetical protein
MKLLDKIGAKLLNWRYRRYERLFCTHGDFEETKKTFNQVKEYMKVAEKQTEEAIKKGYKKSMVYRNTKIKCSCGKELIESPLVIATVVCSCGKKYILRGREKPASTLLNFFSRIYNGTLDNLVYWYCSKILRWG